MPGKRRLAFPVFTAAAVIPVAILVAAGANGALLTSQERGASQEAMSAPMIVVAPAPKALPVGIGLEQGLQVKTILAGRAISAAFPEIGHIGGFRADSLHWHPEGLAIDVAIPDYDTAVGRDLGDRIVAYVFANADRFGLEHVIWQRTYFPADGPPRRMADLGSDDANHYTHVHIATEGGGYPTGAEKYFG